MSRSRKHVTAGALQDCPVPEGEQEIARVSEMRGGNIVEVVRPDGEKLLCLMPAKFKKTLWIKRGNFLIIEPFTEVLNKADKKLRGRIAAVLFPDHVKHIERLGLWPSEWQSQPAGDTKGQQLPDGDHEKSSSGNVPTRLRQEEDEEEDSFLVNPNHRRVADSEDESDEEDDDEEEDEETD